MSNSSGNSGVAATRRAIEALDRLLPRYRIAVLLLTAYLAFFYRLCRQAPASTVPTTESGVDLLDPAAGEPLTRTSVLARVRAEAQVAVAGDAAVGEGGAAVRRPAVVRRDANDAARRVGTIRKEIRKEVLYSEGAQGLEGPDADERADVAELVGRARALTAKAAAGREGGDGSRHGEGHRLPSELAAIHTSLGAIHSAHAEFQAALRELGLAIGAAADAGDAEGVALGLATSAQLKLKHYRYQSAQAGFETAFRQGEDSGVLANGTRAAVLSNAGWAALLSGSPITAESHFLTALISAGHRSGDHSSSAAVLLKASCHARRDGLDGHRAIALTGLSLVFFRRQPSSTITLKATSREDRSVRRAQELVECAALLLRGGAAELDRPEDEVRIRHALGLAQLALGSAEAARRQHHRAVHLGAGRGGGDPCRAAGGDLPLCSHGALHLGLTAAVAGNITLGERHVDGLLARADARAALNETGQWFARFARGHEWLPGEGSDGAAFLASLAGRAVGLLFGDGAAGDSRSALRLLTDHGRLLLHAGRPPAEALASLRRARRLFGGAASNIPVSSTTGSRRDREAATLHGLLGEAHYRSGHADRAVCSFRRALVLERQAAAKAGGRCPLGAQRRLAASHAALGKARILTAGASPQRWRDAVRGLQEGRSAARLARLGPEDPLALGLEATYWRAARLAHRRGAFQTCPGPRDALLYGPTCEAPEVVAPSTLDETGSASYAGDSAISEGDRAESSEVAIGSSEGESSSLPSVPCSGSCAPSGASPARAVVAAAEV